MLIYSPGNEYCLHEEARCRNAGCSELYIVHLLDSSANCPATQWDDTCPWSVSVTLAAVAPEPGAAELANGKKWTERQHRRRTHARTHGRSLRGFGFTALLVLPHS